MPGPLGRLSTTLTAPSRYSALSSTQRRYAPFRHARTPQLQGRLRTFWSHLFWLRALSDSKTLRLIASRVNAFSILENGSGTHGRTRQGYATLQTRSSQ